MPKLECIISPSNLEVGIAEMRSSVLVSSFYLSFLLKESVRFLHIYDDQLIGMAPNLGCLKLCGKKKL